MSLDQNCWINASLIINFLTGFIPSKMIVFNSSGVKEVQ